MILMLRALGLGDFLTAVPAYRAIVRAFPRHCRILAAPSEFTELAELVGGIVVAPARPLAPLDAELHGAAVAFNLHGRGPQSHRVLAASQPGRLVAYKHARHPRERGGSRARSERA